MKRLLIASLVCLTTALFANTWTDPETEIVWEYSVENGKACLGVSVPKAGIRPAVSTSTEGEIVVPVVINGYPTEIAHGFYECNQITAIKIPEGVGGCGNYSFAYCDALEEIIYSSTVLSSGQAYGSANLKSVVLAEGMKYISNSAFSSTKLENVVLPESITSIGRRAFADTPLTEIIIKQNVSSVEDSCFSGCTNLTTVIFNNSINKISLETHLFSGCSNISTLKLPKNVTLVEGTFANMCCQTLYIMNSPEEWPKTAFGKDATTSTTRLGTVYVPPEYLIEWGEYFKTLPIDFQPVQLLPMTAHIEIVKPFQNGGSIEISSQTPEWGEPVTISAIANESHIFLGWSSNIAEISGSEATLTFTMPEETVTLVANFFPKALQQSWNETYVQSQIRAGELITSDQLQEMALSAPVIEVKDGSATVGISVVKASSVDGEWEAVELESNATTVESDKIQVSLPADEKAAFYKFVVPEKQ